MAMNYVGKKAVQTATKKFLNQELNKHADKSPGGQWDPYFEYRPNKRGKLKKVKKQIPAYIPEHDAAILAKVRKWAYRLDVQHNILGMRFGWSAVVGAIPEIGDAIDFLLALYVYSMCRNIEGGLDSKTKLKMKGWVVTDALVGIIPFVGDIIDASIKCNARNCRLLEEFLDAKYKPRDIIDEEERMTESRRQRDPTYRPPAPATVYEGWSDDEDHPPNYQTREHSPDAYAQHNRMPVDGARRADTTGTHRSAAKRRQRWGRK